MAMTSLDLRDPHQQLAAALFAAGAAAALVAFLVLRRKPASAQEKEQRRRAHLGREGRIIDGTVLDIAAPDGDEADTGHFIFYQYEIAGVTYQSSQDVSQLRDYVDIDNCLVDIPASVRYDARNPTSSMIVSETWNGLRPRSAVGFAALK